LHKLIEQAAEEPISLQEARMHLRLESGEDDLIMRLIVSGKGDTCRNPRPGMHGRSGYQLLLGFWDFQLSGNKEWISPIFIDGKRESTSVR
jgi:hypothetical protein